MHIRIRPLGTAALTLLALGLAMTFPCRVWSGVPETSAGPTVAPGARVLPPNLASKLDGRLLPEALTPGEAPVAVWLTFADKGERGVSDLMSRLAQAEAALTPRARARRLRAQVTPLVDERDLPVEPAYLAELERRGLSVVAVSRWLNRAAVRTPGARLAELAELPFVTRIAPVERVKRSLDPPGGGAEHLAPARSVPPTPSGAGAAPPTVNYGQTFHMIQQMNVPAVHDSGYIGTGVLVCILDDGFKGHTTHQALQNVVIAPGRIRDFVDGDLNVDNPESVGHGTWVMGCIAANLQGTYVGSGFGAEFALGRTEVDASETPVEMLFWGMGAEWADSLGADLISSSLGYFTFDNPADSYTYADLDGRTTDVSRSAEIAASKGILVVTAVGNEGNTPWHFLIAPSDVHTDSVIAVGAVDVNGVVGALSSYGPSAGGCIKPDLAARGVSDTLVSNFNPAGYITLSGTSFATPLVAGLATCMLQARPTWTPAMISRALRETASQADSPDNRLGWGIPNGLAALRWDPGPAGVTPFSPNFSLQLVGANPLRSGDGPVRIQFGLGSSNHDEGHARVRVMDAQGRVVRDLYSGSLVCDETVAVLWDGRGGDGDRVRPGLYIVALESGGKRRGARIVVLP